MAARATTTPAAVLVGPPGAVLGVVDVPAALRRSVVLVPGTKGDLAGARVLTAPVGDDRTEVRLLLPESTVAGERPAQLLWDDGAIDVLVDVLGTQAVEVRPTVLAVRAAPGEVVPVSVHLVNRGNVTVEVAKVGVLAFEERDVLERAVVAGLGPKVQGLDRWAAAADRVFAAQSGAARVVVTEGAGGVEPGASTWVRAEVHVPGEVAAGSAHAATWVLAGTRVRVEVDVTSGDPHTPVEPGLVTPVTPKPRTRSTAKATPARRRTKEGS